MLDRRRQDPLQDIDLGLGLVLQQAPARRGIGPGLKLVQTGIARPGAQLLADRAEQFSGSPRCLQRLQPCIGQRARMRVAVARLAQDFEGARGLAGRLACARRKRLDHRTLHRAGAQRHRFRSRLFGPTVAQQRACEAIPRGRLGDIAPVAQRRGKVCHRVAWIAGLGAQLGAYQLEFDPVGMLAVGCLRHAVLGFCDPLGRHRVRAQVARRAVVERARRALHALEKHRHRAYVEASSRKHGESDAVGFAFEVARVVDLRLHRPRLRGHDGPLRQIRPRTRREHRDHQRRHGREGEPFLHAEQAGDMALRDVRDFVRKHRGEFGLGFGGEQQPGVHTDKAARQRKRVDGRIPDREELEIEPRAGTCRDQLLAQHVQVLGDLRVVQVARFAIADVARNAFAEAPLHLRRQLAARWIAKFGQRLRVHPHAVRGGEEQNEKPHLFMIPCEG